MKSKEDSRHNAGFSGKQNDQLPIYLFDTKVYIVFGGGCL